MGAVSGMATEYVNHTLPAAMMMIWFYIFQSRCKFTVTVQSGLRIYCADRV